jgi:WD40 repeat protein
MRSQRGKWRSVLAAVTGSNAVSQAGKLAEIARAQGSDAAFRTEIAEGVHAKALRDRLANLDEIVAKATDDGNGRCRRDVGESTWRLLFSLRVRELRLEGADSADRTFTVTRLRSATTDNTPAAADMLFSKLCELAGRYAPEGASADANKLRRDLSGIPLLTSRRHLSEHIYPSGDGTWTSRLARRPIPGCPYRGLNAFEEQDSDLFFGRTGAIDQVMGRLSDCAGSGGNADSILVVSGASGAGKSSLLQAGVLPRLRRDGLTDVQGAESWPCLVFTPGRTPLGELTAQVATLAGLSGDESLRTLQADPASFRMLARQAVVAKRGQAREQRLLLVVDQFEQLFTRCPDEEERRAFIAALRSAASAAEPSALVVIGIRADFEVRCANEYAELTAAIQHRFLLTAMTDDELELAITEPARLVGSHVDKALTDRLLREIRTRPSAAPVAPAAQAAAVRSATRASAGILPLLSYALAETWRVRTGDILTLPDYHKTGGIGAAVEKAAQRAYGELAEPQKEVARRVFLQLTATSADGTVSSVPAPRDDLDVVGKDPRDVQAVLDAFAGERLLTLTADGAEINHEVLLTAWPLLADTWLEQTRTDRVIRSRLRDAASEWDAHANDSSYLWSGALLDSALTAARASGNVPALTSNELRFLDASERAARSRTRLRRAVLALVCALVLVAAMVGAYSVREHQDAERHAATVDSTQLADDAQALRLTDPGLAAQLAVAAYRYAPTEQAAAQMYDSLSTPLDSIFGSDGGYVVRVAARVDGSLAADVAENGALRVWNVSDASAPVLDATIRSQPSGIALSTHGGLLAGACRDRRGVCLWSVANPRHPVLVGSWFRPAEAKTSFTSMAISPDGKLLAAASKYGFTLVWWIGDPSRPHLIADLPNPTSRDDGTLAAVAFAPHGHVLAETILGGTTRLWSVGDPARLVLLATIKAGYSSIVFAPADGLLAAVGDAKAGLWQIGDPRHPKRLPFDASAVSDEDLVAAAFSPDGQDLAFTGLNTNNALAEVCTLRIPDVLLDPQTGPACTSTGFQPESASYTANDALLTGGPGGLSFWHWPEHLTEGELVGDSGPGQVSPGGRLMATGVISSPDQVDIWSLAGLAAPVLDATIRVSQVGPVQFLSPSVLLIADGQGRTRLWDLRDPHHPVPGASLGTAGTESGTIGAESIGHLAGIQGRDGRLHLWRITSATDAVQAGSIPGAPAPAGIDPDSQTAYLVNGNKIQWWDISDPAHPVPRDKSVLPGDGSLSSAITAGPLVVATTTIDSGSGTALATSNLVLFEVVRGRVRNAVTLSTTAGPQLQVSPDHHLLAVEGSGDDAVTLWNISDPQHPRRLSTVPAQLDISGMEFSPDGTVLAVASLGAVQLWDVSDPEEPASLGLIASLFGGDASANSGFATEENPVFGLAFTGRADTLAISTDTTTSLFETDPAQLETRLCEYAGVPINHTQWLQDAPNVPYQRPCP